MEQIQYHNRLFELKQNFHELSEKDRIMYNLIDSTKGRVKKWGETEWFSRHLLGDEPLFPPYGYDFYFTESLLNLCINKTFIEEDKLLNFNKAKDYLYENIMNIDKELNDSKLWKLEGNKFILDFNEKEGIILKNLNKQIKTFEPIKYSEEEIKEDKKNRILNTQKHYFNHTIEHCIRKLINQEKLHYLRHNSQFTEFVSNKFFNIEQKTIVAEKFIQERLKTIIDFCKKLESNKNKECVIHYDSRIGIILKNETGKFLLRLPYQS